MQFIAEECQHYSVHNHDNNRYTYTLYRSTQIPLYTSLVNTLGLQARSYELVYNYMVYDFHIIIDIIRFLIVGLVVRFEQRLQFGQPSLFLY